MKTTLYMAMSANGMIATEAGDENFLSHEHWEKFCELAREHGNIVVGRKTYEAVRKWDDGYNFDDLEGIEKVVISRDHTLQLDEGYTRAHSPQDALTKLSRFQKVLITGGATINTACAKDYLLDEIILSVEPVFVGRGIPLFAPDNFELRTTLLSADRSASGILTLTYACLKK